MAANSAPARSAGTEDGVFWGWLDGYLNGIIGIAILGSQITFTVLVSEIADPAAVLQPATPAFGRETVRAFIGVSWLLFIASLGISSFTKVVLSDPNERAWLIARMGVRRFRSLYSVLTLVLDALSVVPFLFLALATTAYLPVIGWIGTAFVSLFSLVVAVSWFLLDWRASIV
ncbi:hypothetical protein B0T24DRAFT_684651 [Lasiosphaeria ovina]|uniref:Uncharacterized protein n=1 Tax=Lasiosphaeria ovina TaxID=92902 RepID=A0AAE0JTM2_9PEZI|nr:hypothetical protein B0T24DRAFT_684651 [Lasiosphaeria ovina]